MQTGSKIAARIQQAAKAKRLAIGEAVKRAGLGPSFAGDLKQNRVRSPTLEKVERLAKVLEVSPAWLAYGLDSSVEVADASDPATPYVRVVEIDVRLSAGGGALVEQAPARATWGWPRDTLAALAARPQLVRIQGDSMEPTLRDGDLVLLDLDSVNPVIGGVYALWDSSATVCKRIEPVRGADTPMLRIISDNARYSAYEEPLDAVKIIGRVVWFGRKMGG